ncbi:N-acetylglutamate synthase-like GNAT family acetyltransferase [Variovorax boronicumulans]|uniref:GNAT family N-acetyltransferase n=1 Tax=Variovorax boronicumulans TaxID=436515 RepID=UPI0027838961|nr:GNAT family N-acetyltransferase [Variovorax boronicumulans]MDQ0035706.1 N-acetylglutamate synthase-like GNAT family acetyltransferase [Variovorax boronicumulans]
MRLDIRPAHIDDLEALVRLDTVAAHDARRAAQIQGWIEDRFSHVIKVDGDIAAYGVLHYHFFDCGFIEMLMVGEKFRRKRLGLRLVSHFQSICERPKLFASTNRSNGAMQSLLKEAGFRESGHIDNLDAADPEQVFFWPCER